MSKTAVSVRNAVVPSCPYLPLERLAFSIVNMRTFSREFFNRIDPLQPLAVFKSGQSRVAANNTKCQ